MRRTAVPAMVLALLVAGCGSGGDGDASGTGGGDDLPAAPAGEEPADTEPADRSPPAAGTPESLDFTATTVSGDPFDGATLAGRPTLLWFWAPWCPTCRSQIPQVEGLADQHADALEVVGVGSLDSAEAIAEFADDVSGVTHLEDVDGELWRRFGIAEQSSFVLLDAEGEVAFQTGYGGSEELDARVDDVLG